MDAMSKVMTLCPATNTPIFTGMIASGEVFRKDVIIGQKVRCPNCGRMHTWSKKDAWVKELSSYQTAS